MANNLQMSYLNSSCKTNETGKKEINFRDIYLLERKEPSPIPGNAFFEVRKYNEGGGTEKIGIIHVNKTEVKPLLSARFPEFTQKECAEEKFKWYGHENDRNFMEQYVGYDTIRRYYHDDWILEYKVDKRRKSIISSFRWMKKGSL